MTRVCHCKATRHYETGVCSICGRPEKKDSKPYLSEAEVEKVILKTQGDMRVKCGTPPTVKDLARAICSLQKPELTVSEVEKVLYEYCHWFKSNDTCKTIAHAICQKFAIPQKHTDFEEHNTMTLSALAEHLGVDLWKAMEIARMISLRPQVETEPIPNVGLRTPDNYYEMWKSAEDNNIELTKKIAKYRELLGLDKTEQKEM